ncbi:hypothetical protein [Vibrio aquimaris]|uniref:Uncharacterized protein n=1 Tax=Vibrio aquimaris TaxID=2587862 RepID=A0A5P9CPT3_9VIBR|nr:hypothetical protein [Vibrio aquimaris]QFT28206.1 hypothetical protein FIV01_17585 [Vibrio aquimaris]
MINNINELIARDVSSDYEPIDSQTLKKEIDATNKAELELKKADKAIATLQGQPADAEVLAMVANHQKQVVMTMSGANPEDAIAMALAQGIEAYAKQLEIIKGWTIPGLPMFESAMAVMFEGIKSSGETSGYALEDLFQLAIMDFMSHGYGEGKQGYASIEEQMRHFLESTGSGSHGYHEGWDGAKFARACDDIFDFMMANSPPNSLCHEILTYMNEECGGVSELEKQYRNHFNDPGGFVCETGYSGGLSPMLRMALMAGYLAIEPKVEQSVIDMFLTAPVSELDTYINEHTSNPHYDSAIEFVFDNDGETGSNGWREVDQYDPNGDSHQVIDWNGVGLGAEYFENMYNNFPERELTDKDIEKINNIGDQVKMLQQTLKYWLSICRDEQMAIARNI